MQRKNNMVYVKELELREFRGIKEVQKPINFKKFNVLIGRNNSCKTTVLQALSILPHPRSRQPSEVDFGGSEKINLVRKLLGGNRSLIYKYSGKASLTYEVLELRYVVEFSEDGQIITRINDTVSLSGILSKFKMNENEAKDWVLFIPNDSAFVSIVERKLFHEWWPRVVKSRSHVKIAREIINPTIDEFFTEIIKEEAELKVRKEVEGEPYYIAVGDLGSGVYKALCMSLFISVTNPKIIIWDDFEAAAHPSLLRKLLEWLSQNDWQVFLATHSIDVLNELVEIKPKDAQIIQMKKTAEDVLTHKTLTIEELSDVLNSGIDPRLLVDKIE